MSKLAELRKANGMTQADVAKLLGVTDKAVGSWEQGVMSIQLVICPSSRSMYY